MPNRCPFHHRGLECKSRKSKDTCSNRKVWPWSTNWSRAKANRALPIERTGHSKSRHPLPTTQETTLHMDVTRWSIQKSDWLYSLQTKMEKLYILSKTRPGANCGSDHELLLQKNEVWKSKAFYVYTLELNKLIVWMWPRNKMKSKISLFIKEENGNAKIRKWGNLIFNSFIFVAPT